MLGRVVTLSHAPKGARSCAKLKPMSAVQLQTNILISILAFCTSWAVSELLRSNASRLKLIQLPNERSSHYVPTPSGGGLAIALASIVSGCAIAPQITAPICVSAAAAVLGLLDDRFDLSARLRLIAHFAFVGMLLAATPSLPALPTPLGELPPWAMVTLLTVGGVWWINVFNFMDGIDGLAASQAVFMGVGAITLSAVDGVLNEAEGLYTWAFIISSASAGFLVLNWPPARIFMGDAGSNFLATAIFALFVGLISADVLSLQVFAIFAALFMTDATITLLGRLRSGSSAFSAHRLHAYQKLSRTQGGHRRATLIYLAINVAWLYPLAYFARIHEGISWWLTAAAYVPIALACFGARAGLPEHQPASGKTQDE